MQCPLLVDTKRVQKGFALQSACCERRWVSTQITWLFLCFSYWTHSCDGREPAAYFLMNHMWPVWMKWLIPSCANVFASVGGFVSIHHLALWAVISQSCFYILTVLPPGVEKITISSLFSHQSLMMTDRERVVILGNWQGPNSEMYYRKKDKRVHVEAPLVWIIQQRQLGRWYESAGDYWDCEYQHDFRASGKTHGWRAAWSFDNRNTRSIFERVQFKCDMINNRVKEIRCKDRKDTHHLNTKRHMDTPIRIDLLATPPGQTHSISH